MGHRFQNVSFPSIPDCIQLHVHADTLIYPFSGGKPGAHKGPTRGHRPSKITQHTFNRDNLKC